EAIVDIARDTLVILAGILIIWREHKLGLERNRQRRAGTFPG
ncbi:MAG: EamA/RhaT family transporter, partial [Paracoccus sp. (in: a-proteobacteria)]|nr:EamA/RhaT family transporter [Paracoccus sp. (in: a-proteobacteria)]